MQEINLQVEISSLKLRNPIIIASGVIGYILEFKDRLELGEIGAAVCKGITLRPRMGNPQPRIAETPSGMLNSIGLENPGLEVFLKEVIPRWKVLPLPAVANIAGETISEYEELAKRLDEVPFISALEVNISCPNMERGGIEFGSRPDTAAEVVRVVRRSTKHPLWVKLSAQVSDLVGIACAVEGEGADALTLINTIKGMAIDVKRRRPLLGNIWGGLSGPAIKPIALWAVYQVSGAVKIPVIGCGGISCAQDALEFIMSGAKAVQIGTGFLINPQLPWEVLDGIKEFMAEEGIGDINRLVGVARRWI